MIHSNRHAELRKFFQTGKTDGIVKAHVGQLREILGLLQAAESPKELRTPDLDLQCGAGRWKGHWSVRVSGRWRVVFHFEGEGVHDVDYVLGLKHEEDFSM
jgi:proteic killer suppression protein